MAKCNLPEDHSNAIFPTFENTGDRGIVATMSTVRKFMVIESDFDTTKKVRAYDISFHYPGFRTHEHLHQAEVNVATLKILYSPRRKLIEFESLHEYVISYKDRAMMLEEAGWSIIADIFSEIEPLYCATVISCELNDGAEVLVTASRGWRTYSPFRQAELVDANGL